MPATTTTLAPGGVNAIGRMLGLLGDEWNLLILQQALMGAHRYSHFAARLPISNSVLSNRLRLLVREGLLTGDYRTTPRSSHAPHRATSRFPAQTATAGTEPFFARSTPSMNTG